MPHLFARPIVATMTAGGIVVVLGLLGACASSNTGESSTAPSSPAQSLSAQPSSAGSSLEGDNDGETRLPDVLKAELTRTTGDRFTVAVTISSPYDSPDQYADGWRVQDENGKTLGEHQLGHDHASEQPFTRTQTDLTIPSGVSKVTVEGRDRSNGYGGKTVTVAVPIE